MSKVFLSESDKKYQSFYKFYMKAYPGKTGNQVTAEASKIWREELEHGKDEKKYNIEMARLSEVSENRKKIGSIWSFLQNKPKPKPDKIVNTAVPDENEVLIVTEANNNKPVVDENDKDAGNMEDRRKLTPAQDKLKDRIVAEEKKLLILMELKEIDLGASAVGLSAQIKESKEKIKRFKMDLRRNKNLQAAQIRHRAHKKQREERLKNEHPEFAQVLKLRDTVGRPRIECDNPGILETMLEIATIGSACGDKRREDIFRTVKTLDQLTEALHGLGYAVKRGAVYLRLIPRYQNSIEGRKHVQTLPVKLVRPQNNLRKGHPDRMFAAETSKAADDIARFLGPDAVAHITQDDKSSVPIGRTAAKKQAPMLMSMRVRVRLPDHDFAVGSRHLLCPSVMAHCKIDPVKGVTYSGETYIALRSSKHNNSSAFSHQEDLLRMRDLIPEVFKGKSVIIKSVDGGPDENPRFQNNQLMALKSFKVNIHWYDVFFSSIIIYFRTWILIA